jgi:prepilin-type N-terminal cleavage/methylation domain-containing protein
VNGSARARRSSLRRASLRRGFSLIEVMVAMTILAVVLLSLARFSAAISKRGRENDLVSSRTAALLKEANKFGAMPFDSLATAPSGSVTRTDGGFTYTRRLVNTADAGNRRTIRIVVTPANTAVRADSLTLQRTRASSSPLCVGC